MFETVPIPDPPRTSDGRVDFDALLRAVARTQGAAPWVLDSHPDAPGSLGWSAVVLRTVGRLTVHADDPVDPFLQLSELCDRLELTPTAARAAGQPPCDGGLIGAVSYDAGRRIERLKTEARTDRRTPDLDMVIADTMLVVDHRTQQVQLVTRALPTLRPPAEIRALIAELSAAVAAVPRAVHTDSGPPASRVAHTTVPAAAYRAGVAAVLERIAAGDSFQVNLTQRLTTTWDGDLLSLYLALRAASPAPYGAMLPTAGGGLASVSPETFLHIEAGVVTIRPIKGTRPRSADPVEDAAFAHHLRASEKDRAENVMVVDMERSDLGRVCVEGSVRVPRLVELEAHPTVWHLVSEVVGTLRADISYADVLRATFPCGSVTGAPKVSSMNIIERLEPVRRGWYCGSFGWLGSGMASTAVAIRTAVLLDDGTVDFGAGGGVVADSDADAEHRESLDKAAAFLGVTAAVAGSPP